MQSQKASDSLIYVYMYIYFFQIPEFTCDWDVPGSEKKATSGKSTLFLD